MADAATAVNAPSEVRRPAAAHPGLTLFALAIAGLVVSVQQTLVLPLLLPMKTEYHTTISGVTWVFTVTLLTGAVATPLLSRFGDMYGKKVLIVVTMGLLVVGSAICAVATTLWVLIVGRALQGVAVAVIPLAIGVIRDTFPREKITTAIGIVSATMGLGGTFGMLVTGLIAQHTTSSHPIFWIATGASVLGLVLGLLYIPATGDRAGGRPDLLGAALLAAWLVCLLLAISQGQAWGWGSGSIIGLFVGAAVLCAVWVLVEQRMREPLVRLSLLVGRRSLSANLASMLLGFAMYGGFTLISQFIETPKNQVGYGLSGSVLDVGLYQLPSTITMLICSSLSGRIAARIGAAWTLSLGGLICGISYIWLAVAHTTVLDFLIFAGIMGIGFGIGYAALGTLAVEHVPMTQTGIASGINSLVRTGGGSVASAVAAAILAADVIGTTTVPTQHAYVLCFTIAGVSGFLTAVMAGVHALRHREG